MSTSQAKEVMTDINNNNNNNNNYLIDSKLLNVIHYIETKKELNANLDETTLTKIIIDNSKKINYQDHPEIYPIHWTTNNTIETQPLWTKIVHKLK